jgi:hypothetical protein
MIKLIKFVSIFVVAFLVFRGGLYGVSKLVTPKNVYTYRVDIISPTGKVITSSYIASYRTKLKSECDWGGQIIIYDSRDNIIVIPSEWGYNITCVDISLEKR